MEFDEQPYLYRSEVSSATARVALYPVLRACSVALKASGSQPQAPTTEDGAHKPHPQTKGPDTHVPSTPSVQDITSCGEYHRIKTVRLKSQADETLPGTPLGGLPKDEK